MFDFALLEKALDRPRQTRPMPDVLTSNRSAPQRVIPAAELTEMNREWFRQLERRIAFLGEKGLDVSFLHEWSAKYVWSWLEQDMSLNHEIYTPDLEYVDPTTFGRTIVGIDDFVAYNMAFFDAIVDWRYTPFPDQMYIDVTPEGEVRLVIRYMGSGFFDGILRLYPYDKTATALQGQGNFVQACATDRYHFTPDGRMYYGETLWDFMDMAQSAGLAPRDDSWQFKALMTAMAVPGAIRKLPGFSLLPKVPFLG